MSCSRSHSGSSCGCGGSQDSSFVRHICRFIGETVIIFTTSGGVSGCGFTGVIISVNSCFVRLVTEQGIAPGNPLSEEICGDFDDDRDGRGCGDGNWDRDRDRDRDRRNRRGRITGSVVDIPIDRIAAFCHNAV